MEGDGIDWPVAAAILVGGWDPDVRDYLNLFVPQRWRCETCQCSIVRIYAHEDLVGHPPHLICSECFSELPMVLKEVRDIVARWAAKSGRGEPRVRGSVMGERERVWRSIVESVGDEPWLHPKPCVVCGGQATRALNHSINSMAYVAVCAAHRDEAARLISEEWDADVVEEYLLPLRVGPLLRVLLFTDMGPLRPAE